MRDSYNSTLRATTITTHLCDQWDRNQKMYQEFKAQTVYPQFTGFPVILGLPSFLFPFCMNKSTPIYHACRFTVQFSFPQRGPVNRGSTAQIHAVQIHTVQIHTEMIKSVITHNSNSAYTGWSELMIPSIYGHVKM